MTSPQPTNGYVLDHARRVLQESPYPELRQLTCDYENGVLTINGEVTTFHVKQLAQTAVQQLDGVEQVRNNASVR